MTTARQDKGSDASLQDGHVKSAASEAVRRPPMIADEMGNPVETFEVWYVESACVPADMYPAVTVCLSQEQAERSAENNRRDPSTWVCVRVTGPHIFLRPDKNALPVYVGPRKAVADDLGIQEAA